MEVKKIKVGDVILNHYASENNPHRKSIVIRLSSRHNGYKCLTSDGKGGTEIIEFSSMDFVMDPKFEIIDNIDFLEFLK